MTRYLLSVHTAAEATSSEPMTAEQTQRAWQAIGELEAELQSRGAWVASARLAEASEAAVVRSAKRGVSKSDGPYADTKEHLGGFYVIEAADRDEALDWASKVSQAIDRPIEVRAFAAYADEPHR